MPSRGLERAKTMQEPPRPEPIVTQHVWTSQWRAADLGVDQLEGFPDAGPLDHTPPCTEQSSLIQHIPTFDCRDTVAERRGQRTTCYKDWEGGLLEGGGLQTGRSGLHVP